jgi:hypothetical protein
VFGDPHNLLCIQTGLTSPPGKQGNEPAYNLYFKVAQNHRDWITSPIFSSIILDMCRSAPLPISAVKEQKLSSWGKEISTCEREDGDRHFDYTCWFDPHQHNRPFMAGVPPNPSMAARIHRALISWRQSVSSKLLYPRMSRKMVSQSTVREWETLFGRVWESKEEEGGIEFTQETLEKIYHQTGVEIGGACEVRQKWYTSGVTPRTYFAQGGDSYKWSKFIQEIAGDLTETLSTTHPITRLNPGRIQLRHSGCYLRIYDLTTFTSNHWECKYFLRDLSRWCHGTTMRIVDAVEGVKLVDLGDLISDYNDRMNFSPSYSLERIASEFAEVFEFHNRAGFLGVYGNINFSTFLHGGSLLMIVESEDEANVAGDDGHYNEEDGMEDVADRIIGANGIMEITKTFRSDQIGAVCLKRGLIQVDSRCLQKIMLIFPSIANIGRLFGFRPPQFPPPTRKTKAEYRGQIGNELFRFLRAIFLSQMSLDLTDLLDLLHALYTTARLPEHGMLPPFGPHLIPVLPMQSSDCYTHSPLDVLLRHHFSEGVIVPKFLQIGEEDGSDDPPLYQNGTWEGTVTRKLKYLSVLEYVVKDEITEVLWGATAYQRLVDVYSVRGSKVYAWTCVVDVPDFLVSV